MYRGGSSDIVKVVVRYRGSPGSGAAVSYLQQRGVIFEQKDP
jgi:hypothetical protein